MPARHEVVIVAAAPWSHLNEYEGEVTIALGDRELRCRLVLPSGRWDAIRPGDRVTAAIWLARTGDAELTGGPPALRSLGGIDYEASGRIEHLDGEWLRLACGLSLDVDLERVMFSVGDHVRVVGALQLDLDPD